MFTRSSEKKIRSLHGRHLKKEADSKKMNLAIVEARQIISDVIGIYGIWNIIHEYAKPAPKVKCVFIGYLNQKRCGHLLSRQAIKYMTKKDFAMCKKHRRIIDSNLYLN